MATRAFTSIRILAASMALACFLAPGVAAAPVEINPDVQSIEKSLEARIHENIRTFLGNENRVIVSVHVKESRPPQARLNGSRGGVDILYAPAPLMNFPDASTLAGKNIRVQSVEVDVQIGGEIEDTTLAEAKEIIQKSLKGLSATVTVNRLTGAPNRGLASEAPTGPRSAELNPILSPIALLIAALLLTGGIVFVAFTLRSSAVTVVDGLSRAFSLAASAASAKEPREPEYLGTPIAFDGPVMRGPDTSCSPIELQNYQRNVSIVKETLAQSPMVFLRTVQESEADIQGLKWLLPSMTSEEHAALKTYLGKSGFNRMVVTERIPATAEQIPWLQDFVERLMLRKIDERTLSEKAIGATRAARLYQADTQHLIQVARKINTPAAWRILTEFLPRESMDRLVSGLADSEWHPLINAAEITPETISATADQILTSLEALSKDKTATEERSSFYHKTLLEPVLQSLSKKEFHEEEGFLNQLESQAPELTRMIRKRHWTLKTLERVPDDALAPAIAQLRNEQRISLLLALPESQCTRLISLLPPGNAQAIASDQLANARTKNDPFARKAAATFARHFLSELKKHHDHGAFELLPEQIDETRTRVAA